MEETGRKERSVFSWNGSGLVKQSLYSGLWTFDARDHVLPFLYFYSTIRRPYPNGGGVEKYGKSEGTFEGDGIVAPCH